MTYDAQSTEQLWSRNESPLFSLSSTTASRRPSPRLHLCRLLSQTLSVCFLILPWECRSGPASFAFVLGEAMEAGIWQQSSAIFAETQIWTQGQSDCPPYGKDVRPCAVPSAVRWLSPPLSHSPPLRLQPLYFLDLQACCHCLPNPSRLKAVS